MAHEVYSTGLLFFTILPLAGCLNGPVDSLAPYWAAQVRGFEAEVRLSDGQTGTLALGGPVVVPDVDRAGVRAYELVSRFGISAQAWYLDASLRLVVERGICKYSVTDCQNSTAWSWLQQGDLAPHGLGYPRLLAQGGLEYTMSRQSHRADAESRIHANDTLELRVHLPVVSGWPNATNLTNTYWYAPGRMLPDGQGLVVTAFREGTPLDPADLLQARVGSPPGRAWQGLMFPEEEEDHFRIGATHVDLVRHAEPTLGSSPDVCVQTYHLFVRPPPAPPGLGQLPFFEEKETETASADVFVLKPALLESWRVKVFRKTLDDSIRFEKEKLGTSNAKTNCGLLRQSPWPSLSFSEGWQMADSLGLSGQDRWGFFHTLGSKRYYGAGSPEVGWHQWSALYIPNHVPRDQSALYQPYQVAFEPVEGTPLQFVLAHPSDVFWK